MTAFLLAIHITVCLALIIIVLIQRGRGGGLVESFSGVESMFGTRTSAFLTKATTILSILFFVTCIGLAGLSARRSRSLMHTSVAEQAAPAQKSVDTAAGSAEPVSETSGESQAHSAE